MWFSVISIDTDILFIVEKPEKNSSGKIVAQRLAGYDENRRPLKQWPLRSLDLEIS